ncbi:RNB domain-containing ribonuclease [Leucobacter sp. CSA2]|uniref:RNB domain-containing ribonuclease n=1 Tax=Leucobacter edaphi TaxID=2796472 RepID=A0A934QE40_9MICO|nr:RNB domain-containing ribonuclease [Leucobacter edaphi]MBK0422593.1 RNB domain-containing ribonuclease [Leucobacter edaphi]
MPARRTRLTPESAHGQLAAALAALRAEAEVPSGFTEAALAEAAHAAENPPRPSLDLREIPFVTLDPPGAQDLDQALHLESDPESADGSGWIARYAIADLPGFVRPGGAIDAEARERGQTLYLPDGKVPLHPEILSENHASLLPEQDRSAFVWTIRLNAAGATTAAHVERAMVRSRAKLDYPAAQAAIDRGEEQGPLALLPVIGELRIAQERLRGGASLNLPDEEIVRDESGYRIERRFPLPVEEWNAQLSLLVGIAAGEMMLEAGIGILRTMPAPTPEALAEFRERVAALGHPWPEDQAYGEFLRSFDREDPITASILIAASGLFRGADYAPFTDSPPEEPIQAAIAAPYAHVTAPLRRLVDRWGLVICEAICAGTPVPEWASSSLAELPALMRASSQLASRVGSAALDRVEAALLRDRVGDVLDATVLEVRGDRARIQISDPPVTTNCPAGPLVAGGAARVRVVAADVPSGKVEVVGAVGVVGVAEVAEAAPESAG